MVKHVRLAFLLIIISGFFCTLFVVISLQNRLSANDVPEMYALQTAQRLRMNPDSVYVPLESVDVAKSLLPFLSIYDRSGKLIASSALLDGKKVELPKGVVQHAAPGKNHTVTWAPREDVRLATVTVATDKYYVVGGQSLRNVELRIDRIMQWWLFGFISTLSIAVIASYILSNAVNGRAMWVAATKPSNAAKKPKPRKK